MTRPGRREIGRGRASRHYLQIRSRLSHGRASLSPSADRDAHKFDAVIPHFRLSAASRPSVHSILLFVHPIYLRPVTSSRTGEILDRRDRMCSRLRDRKSKEGRKQAGEEKKPAKATWPSAPARKGERLQERRSGRRKIVNRSGFTEGGGNRV